MHKTLQVENTKKSTHANKYINEEEQAESEISCDTAEKQTER